jgi:hypothetical protein
VELEGPIHFDELVTRMRTLWGLQRAGSRVRDALEQARQSLLADEALAAEGSFSTCRDERCGCAIAQR